MYWCYEVSWEQYSWVDGGYSRIVPLGDLAEVDSDKDGGCEIEYRALREA